MISASNPSVANIRCLSISVSLPRGKLVVNTKQAYFLLEPLINFEQKALHILVDVLRSIPFLHVHKPLGPFRSEGEMFENDGLVKISYKAGDNFVERYVVLEVKRSAQLRDVRAGIERIEKFARNMSQSSPGYGVFASQYLPQSAKDYCKERGVGYFDLSGNCYLSFDQIHLEKELPLTVAPERKRLRSLFSDKSARVIRRLLEYPENRWRVNLLAEDAKVSKATVSLLKDKLVEGSYAVLDSDNSFMLIKPTDLLKDWSRHYNSREHTQIECFATGDLAENEHRFANFCHHNELPYAFTMFSAARRVAPLAQDFNRSHAYVVSNRNLTELARELNFHIVESGGNFRLISPTDSDVLYGSYLLEEEELVSNIQLYLDLSGYKGRGEQNAEYLLEEKIRKGWQIGK